MLAVAALSAQAADAPVSVEPETVTAKSGEAALFPFEAGRAGSDFLATCTVDQVGGETMLVFDAINFVPMSALAPGDRLPLSAGDSKTYQVAGSIPEAGEGYIGFRATGAPASFCFPGQDCAAAEDGGSSVRISCAPPTS